jgi:hypothetical protein
MRNGYGKCTSHKETYEGNWEDNMKKGLGTSILLATNTKYVGYFLNNNKHGKGKVICQNKSSYDGDWVDNKRKGYGRATYPDKSVYEGEWVNNNQ